MALHGSLSCFDFPLLPALGAYTVLSLYLSGKMIKVVVVPTSHFDQSALSNPMGLYGIAVFKLNLNSCLIFNRVFWVCVSQK